MLWKKVWRFRRFCWFQLEIWFVNGSEDVELWNLFKRIRHKKWTNADSGCRGVTHSKKICTWLFCFFWFFDYRHDFFDLFLDLFLTFLILLLIFYWFLIYFLIYFLIFLFFIFYFFHFSEKVYVIFSSDLPLAGSKEPKKKKSFCNIFAP